MPGAAGDASLVERLYADFNARDIDAVFTVLASNVAWANGMDGGHVVGHEAIRAYWTAQWAAIDPHVEPVTIAPADDGTIVVEVHQVVRDLDGGVLLDEMVRHVFRLEGGLVARFDIGGPSRLSAVVHEGERPIG